MLAKLFGIRLWKLSWSIVFHLRLTYLHKLTVKLKINRNPPMMYYVAVKFTYYAIYTYVKAYLTHSKSVHCWAHIHTNKPTRCMRNETDDVCRERSLTIERWKLKLVGFEPPMSVLLYPIHLIMCSDVST